MKIKKILIAALGVPALVAGTALLGGCSSAATPSSTCGFIVGNGENGSDAKIHRVVYPGQQVNYSTDEKALYFPCNSRNFIVNPPGTKDPSGHELGDRHTAATAKTKDGATVKVWLTAAWSTPPEDERPASEASRLRFEPSTLT